MLSPPRGKRPGGPGNSHGYDKIIVGTPTAAANHHLRISERYSFSVACASLSSSGSEASAARAALYGPADSTAFVNRLKSPTTGAYSTFFHVHRRLAHAGHCGDGAFERRASRVLQPGDRERDAHRASCAVSDAG